MHVKKLDAKKLAEALEKYNKDQGDEEALGGVEREIGRKKVLHRQADGKVDVGESVDSAQFAFDNDLPGEDGCIGIEELRAKPAAVTELCAVQKIPLRKGKTTVGEIVDWNGVSQELRFAAGYAAETGQLPAGGARMVVHSLKLPALQPPWTWIVEEATKLRDKVTKERQAQLSGQPVPNPATQQERDLFDRCMARLSRPLTPAAAPPPRPAPVPPPSIGMSWTASPTQVAPDPARTAWTTPQDPARPRIFILADDGDRSAVDDLVKHCTSLPGSRQTCFDVQVGSNREAWLRGTIASADMLVLVVSADALADAEIMSLAEQFRDSGKLLLPYIVRPCIWQDTFLRGCEPLNRGAVGKNGYEVAMDLRRLLEGRRW